MVQFQTFLFFTAGFETSTKSIAYGLFELSQQQDIQDKVRREINDVLKKNNGQLTIEALTEMKYLNQVIEGMFRIFLFLKFQVLNVLSATISKV